MLALRNVWLSASLKLIIGQWSGGILGFILLHSLPGIFGVADEKLIQGSSKNNR